MASHNSRDFEFKLGKLGLVLFTFGIALLLFFSFIFGVMVGKNIESYPEKIAKGIPRVIKETLTEASDKVLSSMKRQAGPQEREEQKDQKKTEKVELDFYDKLTEKEKTKDRREPTPNVTAPRKETVKAGSYIVQVASFRNREQMEKLKSRLTALGYSPEIDETNLGEKGTWFRVRLAGFGSDHDARTAAAAIESKIRGLRCMIIRRK
ncbi:MAG: SPOR domain-containing protein [Deltaproteobacteria bacterium]|nr:SPOR domain-containing protein [Deltaproteobacteria bacterium]MBN2687675.1 SPOR domain-containing protein [Deltaproteobacteria bacterium]